MRPITAAIGIALVLIFSACVFADSPCDHVTLEWIGSQGPLPPDVKIVHKAPQKGLCEAVLSMGGDLVPVYAGKEFILAGQMFSDGASVTVQTMDSLSDVAEEEKRLAREKEAAAAEARKAFFKEHAGRLDALASLKFGPGSATGTIYAITDPNCSHCKAMLPELELAAFEAKKTLKVIIYPVLGPKSRTLAAHAICEKYDYPAYMAMEMPDSPKTCKAADDMIKATVDLLAGGKISFVPVVVAQDGSWVVEGNDLCAVRTHLGLDPGESKAGGGCKKEEDR